MTAFIALAFYLFYAAVMGIGAALAYRYGPTVVDRWFTAVLVIIYYVLAWLHPHRVVKEVLFGQADPGADLRFIVSCLIFGLFVRQWAYSVRGNR